MCGYTHLLWMECSFFRASSPAGLAQAAGDLEAVRQGHVGRVAQELSGDDYYHFSRSFSLGVSTGRYHVWHELPQQHRGFSIMCYMGKQVPLRVSIMLTPDVCAMCRSRSSWRPRPLSTGVRKRPS